MSPVRRSPVRPVRPVRPLCAVALFAVLVAAAPGAFAQEHGEDAPPSPEEVRKKVIEVERLMREAEDSLVRSLDASSAEAKARRAERLLDEKARQSAGKSAEELRKLAESGAKDAAETLRRLTEEANRQASEAAEGVRKLLEETKAGGRSASEGIDWILRKAVQQGNRGDPQESKQKPKDGSGQPQGGKESKSNEPDKQRTERKPPESPREKEKDPKVEKWLAELPPQVRKAYETQDWDSVPPKWRDMLREWTKKMAEDLEKERK